MSDFSIDLNSVYGSQQAQKTAENSTNKKAGNDLVMDDFLKLMVAQFQNQSIDSTADTTEMMNQMVQMSVIQAITNLSTLVTDSTNLSYAASLVGKEVTIGERNGSTLEQIFGTVTGTGTLDGKQVLFLDHKDTPYDIANILAVGSIPDSIPKSDMDLVESGSQWSAWTSTTETAVNTDTGSGENNENGERDPRVPDENGALG